MSRPARGTYAGRRPPGTGPAGTHPTTWRPPGAPDGAKAPARTDCQAAGANPAGDHWSVTGLVRHLAARRRSAPVLFLHGGSGTGVRQHAHAAVDTNTHATAADSASGDPQPG